MEDPQIRNEIIEVLPEPESGPIDEQAQHRYRVFKKNSPFLYDLSPNQRAFVAVIDRPVFSRSRNGEFEEYGLWSRDRAHGIEKCPGFPASPPAIASRNVHARPGVDAVHIYQAPYYRDLNKCINTENWAYNAEKAEFELPTVSKTKVRVLQLINHHGDVNKLRYMPQNPDILASANNVGDVCVYNRTKHSTIKKLGEELKVNEPQLRLLNDTAEKTDIFALDWNKQAEAVLVAASMSGQVNVFDIQKTYAARQNNVINQDWTGELAVGMNDVEWAHKHNSIFITADDSGSISLFDIRSSNTAVKALKGSAPINSISINPSNDFCVATGDAEGQIDIYDIRAMQEKATSFKAHEDAITQVKWHPKFRSVLGSSSADKLVRLFDVADENPLFFSHEGHMLGVNDFDWSMHEDWMIASVADDNSLHLWKPAHTAITKVYC
ncbi:hypothetical protein HF325_001355 [Metschnikowia pulcherrima]|uniref:Translation initiation factor beta propellor-like domain-containing protein n=1 Tax=Metschnikowia pulcherrima TaxID=27326 RepID=A0A8H7GWF2_9ASCO|nr:hypothetical protein HF325_001355 [Metschnikowia pulcherrima]